MKTRNKVNLPISFSTTGNFLNLKKINFIPMDNPPRIKNSKHQLINLQNKNSKLNLSEYHHNLKKNEITKKDELIQKLQEKIKFLETKIKILENSKSKSKNRSRNISISNIPILKTEKNSTNKYNNTNSNSRINKTIIPLDKQLIKTKLIKKKKNIFELIDINRVKSIKRIKNRNNSFNINNANTSHNNSLSNYNSNYTANTNKKNNSCSGSAFKSRKKTIKLNIQSGKINPLHNLLNCINSNKNSKDIIIKDKKYINKKINLINNIPKKGRINQNISNPKIMMSSTNYTNHSNNASNSFKDEINNINTNNNIINNSSFNEMQMKLENIENRRKNLFEFFYSINNPDKNNKKNIDINKDKNKKSCFPFNIKISKFEKVN
jgi:uncharacterized protein (DUF1499 family)